MKKFLFPFIFLILISCEKVLDRKLPSFDIVEFQSEEIQLSIPEMENLAQANILNISIPLGSIDDLKTLKINKKITQKLIFKIIIPANKFILFKDQSFCSNLFSRIEKEIINCISQQIKVVSILFIYEGEKIPEEYSEFQEFLKRLKPLNLSIGLGIPVFLMDKFQEKNLENLDYAVIFASGFPYPPTLETNLLNTYRLNTKEKGIITFPIPFYYALSLSNGAWISSSGVLEKYIIGMPFNIITESNAFEFVSVNLETSTFNPQYIFEAKTKLEISGITLQKGSNVNFMLFSYDIAKHNLGRQSKFLNSNYLGRYYHFYSTEERDGTLNFNTWLSFLKAHLTSPLFDLQISREGTGYTLIISNVSGLYSDFSRENNYLEWEFRPNYFREASVGDFARFRFYYGDEEVLPVQANKIRFFENYIGPFESIKTGHIKVSGELQGIFRISYLLPGGKQKIEILKFQ